jgi:hypothetical protein
MIFCVREQCTAAPLTNTTRDGEFTCSSVVGRNLSDGFRYEFQACCGQWYLNQ